MSNFYFDDFPILEDALLSCQQTVRVEVILPDGIRTEGTSQPLDEHLRSVTFRRLHEVGRLAVTHIRGMGLAHKHGTESMRRRFRHLWLSVGRVNRDNCGEDVLHLRPILG